LSCGSLRLTIATVLPRHADNPTEAIEMSSPIAMTRCVQIFVCVAALGAAVGFPAAAPEGSGSSRDPVTIVVFDERYAVEGRSFDDLDLLEKHITDASFHSIKLLVCGSRATRSLKAVVHRFRHVAVQIRVPDLDEVECLTGVPQAMPVRVRGGQPPFGIDDQAVDRYWRELMP